jgi:small subunit ribosomal protein S20
MKKKQRNRKNILQTKRNKLKNRRYLSTIRTLFKLALKKKVLQNQTLEEKEKLERVHLKNALYSLIDKAVKKGVLHKNNGARKKSKISFLASKS